MIQELEMIEDIKEYLYHKKNDKELIQETLCKVELILILLLIS